MPLKLTAKLICGFPNLWPIQFLLPGHYYSIDQNFLNKSVYIVSLSVAYGEVIGRDTHTSVDFQVDIFG